MLSKKEVGYTLDYDDPQTHTPRYCQDCARFIDKHGVFFSRCQIVKGDIDALGGCLRWQPSASYRQSLTIFINKEKVLRKKTNKQA